MSASHKGLSLWWCLSLVSHILRWCFITASLGFHGSAYSTKGLLCKMLEKGHTLDSPPLITQFIRKKLIASSLLEEEEEENEDEGWEGESGG
jgi:hypothetical protein